MKMATVAENRQFISIIDNEKISKSKAMQNLNNNNNNNPSGWSSPSNNRRLRNDSINCPSWLFSVGNPLSDFELASSLDGLLNDCMWNQMNGGDDADIEALITSFSNSEDDATNVNSTTNTHQSTTNASQRNTEATANGNENAAVSAAVSNSLPPSPTSTCTSVESDTASYAMSILNELEPLSVEDADRYFAETLDEAQLRRIFASSSPAKRNSNANTLWNDEVTGPTVGNVNSARMCQRSVDVKPKVTAGQVTVRRGSQPVSAAQRNALHYTEFGTLKSMLTPQRAMLKRPLNGGDDYSAASKMRRTVAASAAKLGCAMNGGSLDCEVVIREDEHEAIEQVEVEYEVDAVEQDYDEPAMPARVCAVAPRFLSVRGAANRYQPRPSPVGLQQPMRNGNAVNKLQRTASGNMIHMNGRSSYGGVGVNQPFGNAPNRAFNHQLASAPLANRSSMLNTFSRQPSFGSNRIQQLNQDALAYGNPAANRLLGRSTKRMSLPNAPMSSSSTQSDGESSVSMSAPRRGSSSYCSQMERNRRREMNTALAALRRLILEDDRSLLSKVYAKSQLNRRNTSMIMTLRAAHDTVLKLNDTARRAIEERNEQMRRRERLLKRLQQLQGGAVQSSQAPVQTHVQPAAHMTLLNIKPDWAS